MFTSPEASKMFETVTEAHLYTGDLAEHVRGPMAAARRAIESVGYRILRGSGSKVFKQLMFKRDGCPAHRLKVCLADGVICVLMDGRDAGGYEDDSLEELLHMAICSAMQHDSSLN